MASIPIAKSPCFYIRLMSLVSTEFPLEFPIKLYLVHSRDSLAHSSGTLPHGKKVRSLKPKLPVIEASPDFVLLELQLPLFFSWKGTSPVLALITLSFPYTSKI